MLKVKLDANVRIGRDSLYPLPAELCTLLGSIRKHGSLVSAIREVGISYRQAGALLHRWEAITGHALVTQTRGQGTGLTPLGLRFAAIGGWLESRLDSQFDDLGEELARYLEIPDAASKLQVRLRASNDIALVKLKERMARHLTIDLQFEGSLNSLDSLARGDCDVAGFHMPHPPTLLGPLLAQFASRLNAREHYVVWLLSRHQGLMVAKGATRRVRGLKDVARLGLKFVNRERGSGTRLLFDALLVQEGLSPASINGYDHEEFTHMATAATIRAGMADAAFGIEAAACAHKLGFVPVVTEHYYLACRRNTPARIAVDTMVASAQSDAFARALAKIGGYDTSNAGGRVHLSELLGQRSKS